MLAQGPWTLAQSAQFNTVADAEKLDIVRRVAHCYDLDPNSNSVFVQKNM